MLYVEVVIKGVPFRASINTGCQTTIISPAAAERCGVTRLIDTRYSGRARGIGTSQAPIFGRVHFTELQVGQSFLSSSLTVMEAGSEDIMIGVDLMSRYNMVIDFGERCLKIGGDAVPFSPDGQ